MKVNKQKKKVKTLSYLIVLSSLLTQIMLWLTYGMSRIKMRCEPYQNWLNTNKKILLLLAINITGLLIFVGNINWYTIDGRNFVAATAGQSCNATVATTGTHCQGHDHGVAGNDLPVWNDCCDPFEICCDVSTGTCAYNLVTHKGACYVVSDAGSYKIDTLKGACTAGWQCDSQNAGGLVCSSQKYQSLSNWTWFAAVDSGTGGSCCGDDGGNDDFYKIVTDTSPDRCEACVNGAVSNNSCLANQGCDVNGELRISGDEDSTCTGGTDCICYYGEACATTGYTTPTSTALPSPCDSGAFTDGTSANCYSDSGNKCYNSTTDPCPAGGPLTYTTFDCWDPGKALNPSCYYDNGVSVDESDSCTTTGCTGVGNDSTGPLTCDSGTINGDSDADCFVNGAGVNNGTCYYLASDPCAADTDGWDYSTSTACADEGNESNDGWYCYYDEGCTTTGVNSTCSQGERKPVCDAGDMTSSGANCEMWNSQSGTTDVCAGSATDACAADNDGWDYDNDTTIYSTTCTTCDSDYQENTATGPECYYEITCGSAWSGSNHTCYDWCWASEGTNGNCFGANILLNRTEPANATTCYYSKSCTASGCTHSSATMRQDYCDQCEPTGATQSSDYCPTINSSCSSGCANSGTIWYGTAANNITRCSGTNTSCVIATDELTYGDIWTGTGPASCDDTECNTDSIALGREYGVCASGVCESQWMNISLDLNESSIITSSLVNISGTLNMSNSTGVAYNPMKICYSKNMLAQWYDNDTTDSFEHEFRFPIVVNTTTAVTNLRVVVTGKELEDITPGLDLAAIDVYALEVVNPDASPVDANEVNGDNLTTFFRDKDSDGVFDGDDYVEFNLTMSADTAKLVFLYDPIKNSETFKNDASLLWKEEPYKSSIIVYTSKNRSANSTYSVAILLLTLFILFMLLKTYTPKNWVMRVKNLKANYNLRKIFIILVINSVLIIVLLTNLQHSGYTIGRSFVAATIPSGGCVDANDNSWWDSNGYSTGADTCCGASCGCDSGEGAPSCDVCCPTSQDSGTRTYYCDDTDANECMYCVSCSGVTKCSSGETDECDADCGADSQCDDRQVNATWGSGTDYCFDCQYVGSLTHQVYEREAKQDGCTIWMTNSNGDYSRELKPEGGLGTYNIKVNSTYLQFYAENNKDLTVISAPPNTVSDDYFLEPFHGNESLFNRTITFQWLNTTDPDGDSLTYNIQVKQCGTSDPSTCNPDNIDYTSFTQQGEINISGISEGTNITEYISMEEVATDWNYTWRVRAFDGTSYGEWSENWTFITASTVMFTLFDENMSFGSMNPTETNDTTDNSPYPFRIRNDGNVLTDFNITVDTAEDWLWDRFQTASLYFQYQIDNATAYSTYAEENASFNWSASATAPAWFNMPETNTSANIRQLNYSDIMDEAEIDIRIQVPNDEPAGDKGSTVMITGWVSA